MTIAEKDKVIDEALRVVRETATLHEQLKWSGRVRGSMDLVSDIVQKLEALREKQ